MRLTRLVVDAFRGIKRAELDFGSALNILYGPNDLGKSTLASAIRAALLVVPGSSEAGSYASWLSADNPRVELTFVDPAGHYWRVKKTFGSSSSSSAELQHSKDAVTFTQDCKARQVEERLRTMLAWGIPSPGGKGAPRGGATSFLSNVLLAPQSATSEILERSITDDADESGKLRLAAALSSLAQDPLFKEVLNQAQAECDLAFTETGRRKSGKTSRFKEASDRVKSIATELQELSRRLDESSSIQDEVNVLRAARTDALMRLDDAQTNLQLVESRFKLTEERAAAEERLSAARNALSAIEAQIDRFQQQSAGVQVLQDRVTHLQTSYSADATACDLSETALRVAEEAHRVVTSEDSARELEMQRARLSERNSDLNAKLVSERAKKREVEDVIAARSEADRLQQGCVSAKAALDQATVACDTTRRKVSAVENEAELARALVAFVRWRSAVSAHEESEKAKEAAASTSRQAEVKENEALALELQITQARERLQRGAAIQPSADELRLIQTLEREVEKAEAALGGGVSVAVRPLKAVRVRADMDGESGADMQLTGSHEFEAERRINLAVADLVEIEVTAGSAESRRAVETLRERWRSEAVPVLARTGVEQSSELAELVVARSREEAILGKLEAELDRTRAEARSLRETTKAHELRIAGAGAAAEMSTRRDAVGDVDIEILQARFATLGEPKESKAQALLDEANRQSQKATTDLRQLQEAMTLAEYQLSETEKRVTESRAALAAMLQRIGVPEIDDLNEEVHQRILRLATEQHDVTAELEGLAVKASSGVQNAAAALNEAQEAVRLAKQKRDETLQLLENARDEYNARNGALSEMETQIDRLDKAAAENQVSVSEAELAALPDDAAVTPADVEAARATLDAASRAHDHAKEALNLKEGALTRVGGAALREEVERLQDARTSAELKERELEVDADAWKLLRDTLREVENEESTHLGRALAGPVTARFEELTNSRYRDLKLSPTLTAEGLNAANANAPQNEVLEALSVGTREQLAALIRLTIADQLKSTIVLDDHLVHTDRARLGWFQDILQRTAVNAQVIVLTCRPEDYLAPQDLPTDSANRDLAAGTIRVIDAARVLTRFVP